MIDANESRGIPPELINSELAAEQAHVDRVYRELAKASDRAALLQADGLSRGRTERTGSMREEELTGLFERDALVYTASRRQSTLERQHEGLVFGRLDLEINGTALERETRYIGRLGVRDDDYEPLVIDWRAPAAAPFYRATPGDPQGVLRRRVLRCKGSTVVGAEDDLMVPVAPDDLVVLGEGALLAALTRSRHGRMRDIVATIQAHQDEAIRAPSRGITEITGGPGTGKTVVALHRAAYLLYSDRRRYETGGILVVGPSAAYTAYIERVLPSLGEESVVLRSLGDVVDATTTERHDPPDVAALKGTLQIRLVLARAAADAIPDGPTELRVFVTGRPIRLTTRILDRCRARVLRSHRRNTSAEAMANAVLDAAWSSLRDGDPDEFRVAFLDNGQVEEFLTRWWRPVDPREVLLWLADPQRARRYCRGVFTPDQADLISDSFRKTLRTGDWTVADVALIDDLSARLGIMPEPAREAGFYQIEEVDDVLAEVVGLGYLRDDELHAAGEAQSSGPARAAGPAVDDTPGWLPADVPTAPHVWDKLLHGRIGSPAEYAHVLVDEAQDVSPMQWRMLGRRGKLASWTVVGDAAQAAWLAEEEANAAKNEAFGSKPRSRFHMGTNYRNSREIFDYAAKVIRVVLPDADVPEAVRETGVEPLERNYSAQELPDGVEEAVSQLLEEVDGDIAVVTPQTWSRKLHRVRRLAPDRVLVCDPLSTKGLEYDATVVVDPQAIADESPGGVRTLYVVLTRAAHRMLVVRVTTSV